MGRRKKINSKNIYKYLISVIFLVIVGLGYEVLENKGILDTPTNTNIASYNLEEIPAYTGEAFVTINNNIPFFEESDFTEEAFENYSEWDILGRNGVAFANICKEIMPKDGEKRESISNVKNLSGWIQKEYPSLIGTKYLYNRCHLIGWQLSAENDNVQNLMTGTVYLNHTMLEYENQVAEYIKKNTKNNYHVLYRVTPIFEGDNKLASRSRNRSAVSRK